MAPAAKRSATRTAVCGPAAACATGPIRVARRELLLRIVIPRLRSSLSLLLRSDIAAGRGSEHLATPLSTVVGATGMVQMARPLQTRSNAAAAAAVPLVFCCAVAALPVGAGNNAG
eukprot:SAG31_NODE_6726_length_1909_cov_1.938674_3_plen_115_part_01